MPVSAEPLAQKADPARSAKERIDVHAPAVPCQFVVKFRESAPMGAGDDAVSALDGHFSDQLPDADVCAVDFSALASDSQPESSQALMCACKKDPNVDYVVPNYVYSSVFTPYDPGRRQQYAWNS